MVDLPDSGPVVPVTGMGLRREQQPPEQPAAKAPPRSPKRRSTWRENIGDVAVIMGIPEAELTPRVHEALTIIMGHFDSLRDELTHAKEHITLLEEQADRHPRLPAVSRRALMRELARVIAHAERGGIPSSLACFAIANAGAIRRRWGRAAVEAVAAEAVRRLKGVLRASDVVGGVGDAELAVVLALSAGAAAEDKARELAAALAAGPVAWAGQAIPLDVRWALAPLRAGADAETALAAADPVPGEGGDAGGGTET